MKVTVDNQIVKLFLTDPEIVLNSPLGNGEHSLQFTWPSLLEYLELGQLASVLPPFGKEEKLFTASVSALCEIENPEDLFYVYDSLFTTVLKRVKALAEIDAQFLLEKIEEKKGKLSFWEMEKILSPALEEKEKIFKENPAHAIHDLVLYLAWDRMCVYMARLFDYQSADVKFLQNLKKLKWCLIESYQHIVHQGRTLPSFGRMMTALFYYQMREEHLQLHPESDWELLTQSFPAIKAPNELIDFFYIDYALVPALPPPCHLTLDSPEIVQCRLDLAHYMIGRLKEEIPQWKYSLQSSQIIHLAS